MKLLEARDLLLKDDRLVILGQGLVWAIEQWRERHFAPGLDASTRASIIKDHFYQKVQEDLAPLDGFEYAEKHNQKSLLFDERLLVRVKHLDRLLRSSNYPTPTAEAFIRQDEIPDFPDFAFLHFGYRLDPSGLEIRDAFFALPHVRRDEFNEWVWQILGSPTEEGTYREQGRLLFPNDVREVKYVYEDFKERFA